MINLKDSVGKKHKDCQAECRLNPNTNTYRIYCLEHNKWLHTLTEAEANSYFELLDAGELA